MPQTFATSEEQRNNFTFDEEKEKYVWEKSKKLLGETMPYFCMMDTFRKKKRSTNHCGNQTLGFKERVFTKFVKSQIRIS